MLCHTEVYVPAHAPSRLIRLGNGGEGILCHTEVYVPAYPRPSLDWAWSVDCFVTPKSMFRVYVLTPNMSP